MLTTAAFLLASVCAPQSAPPVEISAAPGPYGVGVKTLVLVDASRDDPYAGGKRTLVTEVWYPTAQRKPGGKPVTFTDFFGQHREFAAAFAERFGGEIKAVNRRFRSVGVRGARLKKGKYPLLVFSHGNGGVRHQNVFQMDHLASHGYVVASPDHTGNAGVTPLPGKALLYDRKGRGRSGFDRPRDVSFIITQLLEASTAGGGWLRGCLDGDRIGVLGHSFGGLTACKVADLDDRVKAILPMTVAVGRSTTVPLLVMLGAWDRTVRTPGNRVAESYYKAADGPKHLVVLKRGGHFTFSDMDRINPAFGDGIGEDRETGQRCVDNDHAKDIINAYTRAFFDRYLRGDDAAGELLAKNLDPREVELEGELPEGPAPAAQEAPRGSRQRK